MKRRACVLLLTSATSLGTAVGAMWLALAVPRMETLSSGLALVALVSFAGVLVATAVYVVADVVRRKWLRAFLTGTLGLGCVLFLLAASVVLTIVDGMSDVDHFADGLELPADVELEDPASGMGMSDREWRPVAPGAIRLREGEQGGIYAADVWCNPGEAGTLYLRAFEITRGVEISRRTIPERTRLEARYAADPAEMQRHWMHFTIYEGNWGQYYGARIELWFKPADGRPERKLLERNYRVQGWSR